MSYFYNLKVSTTARYRTLKKQLLALWYLKKFVPAPTFKDDLTHQVSVLLKDVKHRCIIDWSAKSGCSLAAKIFFKQFGILDEVLRFNKNQPNSYRSHVFYRKYPITTLNDLKNPEYTLIKITRNPYTRIISIYNHVVNKPITVRHLRSVHGISEPEKLTFREFLHFLDNLNLQENDIHLRAQRKLYEINNIRKPVVAKLESLPEDLQAINDQCGLHFDIELAKKPLHVSKNRKASAIKFAADMPYTQLKHSFPSYELFYDQDTYEHVTRLFKEDIEAYEYTFPWPERIVDGEKILN